MTGILSEVSIAQATTSAVPFTLQVISIALAPMLGFAGVAIGAYLKDKSDRKQALRAERRNLYVEFVHELSRHIQFISAAASFALSDNDRNRGSEFIEKVDELDFAVNSLCRKINLIGSTKVAVAATHSLAYIELTKEAMLRAVVVRLGEKESSIDLEYSEHPWIAATERGNEALDTFEAAAMEDLDVPKRDRRRIMDTVPVDLNHLRRMQDKLMNEIDRRNGEGVFSDRSDS